MTAVLSNSGYNRQKIVSDLTSKMTNILQFRRIFELVAGGAGCRVVEDGVHVTGCGHVADKPCGE